MDFVRLPRSVHILCLGTLINRAGAFLLPFLAIYLRDRLDFPDSFATTAMGVYGVGWFAASLYGGHFADLVGRKVVMIASLFGGAAILMIFGYLRSPATVLAALMAFALVMEMYRPAASALIADLTTLEQRPYAFGLMYVAINLGFSVAAVVGGKVAGINFQYLFWGDAATAAVYGLIIFFTVHERFAPHSSPAPSDTIAGTTGGSAARAAPIPKVPFSQAFAHILRDRVFVACWFGSFFLSVAYIQSAATLPLYLRSLGISPEVYGRILAVNGILIVLAQLPMTHAIVRFHRGRTVALSALIIAVGFAMFVFVKSPVWFAVAVGVWTVGEIMNSPLMSAIVSDLAPVHLRARYMGAFANCPSMALIAGAPLGGLVLQTWGGPVLWAVTTGVALAAATAYALVRNKVTPRAHLARI